MFRRLMKWLFRLFVVAVLLGLAAIVALFIDYKKFLNTPVVAENSPKSFAVKPGDTISSLINRFDSLGIQLAATSDYSPKLGRYYFRYLAKSTQRANRLKVGEYALEQGMTPSELLDVLISGKTITYKVRFLEGWNFKKLRATLAANPHVEQTLTYVPDTEVLAALGLGKKQFYEGMFFPDTYQFPKQTKDSDILKQAYHLMQKNLQTAWQARDKSIQLKSPYELLIMASLIEKETSLDSERKQVSGVFHRRLAKGMRLQTDPTVIYGLGDKYRGTIYKSDLKKDTPYNTYTRSGLPPTPIAMPGLASLMAAGQPDSGKALYFVANGRGGHTFTATYKEHLKAVKAYRQQQKQSQ